MTPSDLATLVGIWRSSRCLTPPIARLAEHVATAGFGWPGGDATCDGDNHVEGCPCKAALDDVIAAHNALGAPGMR